MINKSLFPYQTKVFQVLPLCAQVNSVHNWMWLETFQNLFFGEKEVPKCKKDYFKFIFPK